MTAAPMPDASTGAATPAAARQLGRSWWLDLVLGALWVFFGMFVLSYNVGSLLALAGFAGGAFIATGVTQLLTAGRVDSWRWRWVIGGALSIIAGILTLFWPGITLLEEASTMGMTPQPRERRPPAEPAAARRESRRVPIGRIGDDPPAAE